MPPPRAALTRAAGQRAGLGPQRTCVACRRVADKADLIRLVRSPLGSAVVDYSGRIPGRGAYLCRVAGCWDSGVRSGKVARALRLELSFEAKEVLLSDLARSAEREVAS